MLMKNGLLLPEPLLSALANNEYATKVFAKMCPFCQSRYAGHISEAKSEEIKMRRALCAVEQICKYGQRHNI